MLENFGKIFTNFYENNIMGYLEMLYQYPIKLVLLIIDISLVAFLIYKFFIVIATALSSIFELKILNYILTSFMTYGVIILIVVFQPELRRALEQLRY